MQLLVSIVTDWLFVFCIVLICDYYLALNKRDNTYKYILATALVAVCSVCKCIESNVFFEGGVILITIACAVALCFKEKIIIIKNSIFRNSLIFQGLPPIKYQNLMYFPLFLPL